MTLTLIFRILQARQPLRDLICLLPESDIAKKTHDRLHFAKGIDYVHLLIVNTSHLDAIRPRMKYWRLRLTESY